MSILSRERQVERYTSSLLGHIVCLVALCLVVTVFSHLIKLVPLLQRSEWVRTIVNLSKGLLFCVLVDSI